MVYISFFKAEKGGWDDKIIDKVTGGNGYSHCEILTSENSSIGSHYLNGGVIEYKYNDLMNDNRWDIWKINIPESRVMDYLKKSLGQPYDLSGVITTALTPFEVSAKDSKWCSELVAKAINQELGDYFNPLAMPNELVRTIIKSGHFEYVTKNIKAESHFHKVFYGKEEIDRFGRIEIKKRRVKKKWYEFF